MNLEATTDALFKALRDGIPAEWSAVHLNVTRTRKPEGGDAFKIQVSHPKKKRSDFGPTEKFLTLLGDLATLGPDGWQTFQLKGKQKRDGGWHYTSDFFKGTAGASDPQ